MQINYIFAHVKGYFQTGQKYGRKLYVFEDGEAHEVARLSQNVSEFHMMGAERRSLILLGKKNGEKSKQYSLYCYDLSTNSKQVIYQGEPNGKKTSYFAEDGTCFISRWMSNIPKMYHSLFMSPELKFWKYVRLTKGYPLEIEHTRW